ncbi:MAG: tRNA uridine-5-carboxymethylaminomethyl(34) synthesis enzyme MnmG [Legionellales bacterium]|nr:tRNA uridine-5-carboxymethylaminomethyl(34) synthesis enzyme MnmG [Legionellales bacterium]
MSKKFDVIVVGGGHAGIEAAMAAYRMGVNTVLITNSKDDLGVMSCNPAIGGIGKSHLVKEIDALDGIMGRAIDRAGIQFRKLNSSKGPAVWATRAQADRELYKKAIKNIVTVESKLEIIEGQVVDLLIENCNVIGVKVNTDIVYGQAVVLTVGTFLAGKIHIGEQKLAGGRVNSTPSNMLATKLREICPNVARLKTGTPPRLNKETINFDILEVQEGDKPTPVFSFLGNEEEHPTQVCCHIAYTTEETHSIIRNNLTKSAMYSGAIEGIGPRYCPSIEDKIVRFADKSRHQIFIEPEGLNAIEIYPNGLSTSLPLDVQTQFIRSIVGFEQAEILQPGYAIEYDFFDPRDLNFNLETKTIRGLFFAGQINGTTGYEEAASQGLLAGINASLKIQGSSPWWPKRDEAYLGVLIDDLITKGTTEPYRMFTSRAEFRLYLREDNADLRLTPIGRKLGVVGDFRWGKFTEKKAEIDDVFTKIKKIYLYPDSQDAMRFCEKYEQKLTREYSLFELLKRPNVELNMLVELIDANLEVSSIVGEQVTVQAKYQGYIDRQIAEIKKMRKFEKLPIPEDFNFDFVKGLSNEVIEKLTRIRPSSLGQASRIPGITPASISILMLYLKKAKAEIGL